MASWGHTYNRIYTNPRTSSSLSINPISLTSLLDLPLILASPILVQIQDGIYEVQHTYPRDAVEFGDFVA